MSRPKLLPKIIHPIKLAKEGCEFKGGVRLRDLPRIQDFCIFGDEWVLALFEFGQDHYGNDMIKGQITCNFVLQCQRCMENMPFALKSNFQLVLVFSPIQMKQLPAELEPLVLVEDEVDLYDIITDEILLSLPQIPKHAQGECGTKIKFHEKEKKDFKKNNPFSKLSILKKKL